MKIAFRTFGCRLNRAEASDMQATLAAAGHEIVDLGRGTDSELTESVPDLVVVRGCSVTARAQRDCEREIERLRRRFPSARVQVTGCLPGASARERGGWTDGEDAPVPMDSSRAFLKVQDGCDGRCTFCVVPRFRGAPASVPFDTVLDRARRLVEAGYRELTVTGCNLSLYESGGRRLADLLAALCGLDGGIRVRLGSLEPGPAVDEVLDVMSQHCNLCRHLHLALQSGSDAVLRRMGRQYGAAEAEVLCSRARTLVGGDLALGADVIAGFPGETQEDAAATEAFLLRHEFSRLHVFPYSERPDTPAATMPDSVPRPLRLERARALERLGRKMRADFAHRFAARTVIACIERDGNGWSGEYLRCIVKGERLARRSLVRLQVDRVDGDELVTHACINRA